MAPFAFLPALLPGLDLEYIKSLVDEALQRAILFGVVAYLDLAVGEAHRLDRVFVRTRVLDRGDQGIFQVDFVVILLVVAHQDFEEGVLFDLLCKARNLQVKISILPQLFDALGPSVELDDYHLFHATRAELLIRMGRPEEAAVAFERARSLTQNAAERAHLDARRAEVTRGS